MSHLGRPGTETQGASLSLQPVAECLSKYLKRPIPLIKNWVDGIDFGDHAVVLCENVRFEPGEMENDEALAGKMAALADIYVNDAFATAHRKQASTYGVAKHATTACIGPLLLKELQALDKVLHKPTKPVTAVIGGAKISDKLGLLQSLVYKVDHLIVGGGIANTFLKASGYNIGLTLHEETMVETAKKNCPRG